jgi:hypothetical protein
MCAPTVTGRTTPSRNCSDDTTGRDRQPTTPGATTAHRTRKRRREADI